MLPTKTKLESLSPVPSPKATCSSFPCPARTRTVEPQLQNVVSTANLGCRLDLMEIAQRARNAQYNPKLSRAVVMRIREPKTTALIFCTGKIVCTGAKTVEDSRIATRKFARIIQKLGFKAKFKQFKIQNVVASCELGFQLRLEVFHLIHYRHCKYEPEIFPGLVYRMVKPKVLIMVFSSGKIVITGTKFTSEIFEAFDNIYPELNNVKKKS